MITDPGIIKCKVCSGEGCEDGENAKTESCVLGEKSCLYGKTTSKATDKCFYSFVILWCKITIFKETWHNTYKHATMLLIF